MRRSLGAEANIPTKHHGDNKSMCELCSNGNAECEIRHSRFFRNIRESVAALLVALHLENSEESITVTLTKSLRIEFHENLANTFLK